MSDNPGHILPPNADAAGWEERDDPTVPEEVTHKAVQHEDGAVTVLGAQDVEPILEYAKEMARTDQGWSPSRELKLRAVLPRILVEQYMLDKGIGLDEFLNNPAHVKAMLNDPALSDFNIEKNLVHRAYH